MNNEPFEFYNLFGEIKEIIDLIFIELKFFKKQLNKVIKLLPYFTNKKFFDISTFKWDFIKQMLYR